MHFEILVEDQSGKRGLDILVPKILGKGHTFNVHPYKGLGHIPRNMKDAGEAARRMLLNNLPKLLRGYGKTFSGYPSDYEAVVILVCDLDDRCLKAFRRELTGILDQCDPKPETRFCMAIEEGEAWLLGDMDAVKAAYPKAKKNVLDAYVNDSICGTWEKLADAVFPGGSSALSAGGFQAIGLEKSRWAEKITPHMNVACNESPSFCYFQSEIKKVKSKI
ncbi:conserved hypothetical protein [Candidatus Desulfarcum epimagneticum]|uniref:DUF4276 family protein n=1 Tax=uncultured Desulfobacteraceae bacterium TaxID=218296 RepID=A0A484HM52_9BACT|nr:conserved hypothetical protein [uncultured Desulfobacteraceae bacterium]